MTKLLEPIVGMVALATEPLEPVVRVVVPMTKLLKITIGAVFPVIIEPLAPIARAESSNTKPSTLVTE